MLKNASELSKEKLQVIVDQLVYEIKRFKMVKKYKAEACTGPRQWQDKTI